MVPQFFYHVLIVLCTLLKRGERDYGLSLELVVPAYYGGLGDRMVIDEGALHFHSAYPVPRHVHHVVHASEEPEVAVLVPLCPIPREIESGEPAPVLIDITFRIAVYRPQHGGPGVPQHEVPRAFLNRLPVFIDYIGLYTGKGLCGRARL